jgi:hypothetical protein
MMNDMFGISTYSHFITPFQGFMLWHCHSAGLCPALVYAAHSGQKMFRQADRVKLGITTRQVLTSAGLPPDCQPLLDH